MSLAEELEKLKIMIGFIGPENIKPGMKGNIMMDKKDCQKVLDKIKELGFEIIPKRKGGRINGWIHE